MPAQAVGLDPELAREPASGADGAKGEGAEGPGGQLTGGKGPLSGIWHVVNGPGSVGEGAGGGQNGGAGGHSTEELAAVQWVHEEGSLERRRGIPRS